MPRRTLRVVDKPDLRSPEPAPTYKQEQYAAALVEQLRENGHFQAERFAQKVLATKTIGNMSTLIGRMKKALEELKEADEFVDTSHRENP